jgi:predicted dehydrogenase/threonine dehydrogenase-like Zn-dependent dehydrogenase
MKQIFAKGGTVALDEVPAPLAGDYSVLVKVIYSCISAGTEVSSVDSSGQSLLDQVVKQPGKLAQAYNTFKKEGLAATVKKIQRKLDSNAIFSLGYSASGVVLSVGKNIKNITIGDRVACAGAGVANHAEYINVPRNLLVRIPDNLELDIASTVTLGAIAMQAVRRADVKLGSYVAVIGLGVLGQITAQLLRLNGCRVIGIDLDERRVQKAVKLGLDCAINPKQDEPVKAVMAISNGYGVDTVIIAAATTSEKPLSQAFQMCRKKGRVVLLGVVRMEINREDMYKKELDLLISTSYGPGRYDERYEEKGIDYPYAYVRWTENRNMEEYLRLIADKKINIRPLIEKEYKIEEATKAYEELKIAKKKPLIILLRYSQEKEEPIARKMELQSKSIKKDGRINIAIIGAGNFVKEIHLPHLVKLKNIYNIFSIVSRTGDNAKSTAQEYGAKYASTNYREVLEDEDIDAVIITTRHNLHARIAIDALKTGKAVFLEKPMALNKEELSELIDVYNETRQPFMVGFNRRFSKYAVEAKKHIIDRINPIIINYQMNAGYLPLDHWVHTEEGGGRIIGEACHIFDLFNYFTEAEVESVSVDRITPKTEYISATDNAIITLKYKDGSVCTLTYTALGNTQYPKEVCQIYFDSKIIVIDDYKKMTGYGVKLKNISSIKSEKGQYEELIHFSRCLRGESKLPIPLWQMIQATEMSFMVEGIL